MPGRKEQRFDAELAVKLEGGGAGRTRNVSASGVYFETDVTLEAGEPVRFSLEFLDLPSGPIGVNCSARVVRVVEQGASRGIGAAIDSFEFNLHPRAGKGSD